MIIIDYKSGATAADYKETSLYDGQKMQLLVYLRAAQDFYKLRPAGFYYFNMHNNFTDVAEEKVYTYQGRTLNDIDVVRAIDTTLETSSYSEKLDIKLKKDGMLPQKNSLITAEQFEDQVTYATELIKRAGKLMHDGYIAVNPYDGVCAFCDYKDICDFGDVYNYSPRKVKSVTAKTISQIVRPEEDDDYDEDDE